MFEKCQVRAFCRGCGYDPSGARAVSSGVLEIRISPTNGWLNSRIRKSAADAEMANTNIATVFIGVRSENKLKLI
ncbi:MAG: hypothetical protein WBF62_20085, partial [Bradyrhizobium sp.]